MMMVMMLIWPRDVQIVMEGKRIEVFFFIAAGAGENQ